MARIYWTDEELMILRDAAEKGVMAKQLAQILKSRTKASIDNKARELGVSLAGGKPEIDRKAYRRIMKELGES